MNSGSSRKPSKKCSASKKTRRSWSRRKFTESAAMATASSSVVRSASVTCSFGRLGHDADGFGVRLHQLAQDLVVLGPYPGPAGGPEGDERGRRQTELGGGPGEELLVLVVGAGPSPFDETDAEMVELLGHPELVVDGEREAFLLGPVAQRGVEDVDGVGQRRQVEPVAVGAVLWPASAAAATARWPVACARWVAGGLRFTGCARRGHSTCSSQSLYRSTSPRTVAK